MAAWLAILRIPNVLMTGVGVMLGIWLSGAGLDIVPVLLLTLAGMAATAFGNVVNDLYDIPTDRISHPGRPLARGAMKPAQAWILAAMLAAAALASGFAVSTAHGTGVCVPLALLWLYAYRLKATPLAGNVLVSLLVAYPLIFGSLAAPCADRIYIPSVLAFLLNLCREIVKDVQDSAGDRAAGLATSSSLPPRLLTRILGSVSVAYAALVFAPSFAGHFGMTYTVVCAAVVLPLHVLWARRLFSPVWPSQARSMSLLVKLEMLSGLAALALDQALSGLLVLPKP